MKPQVNYLAILGAALCVAGGAYAQTDSDEGRTIESSRAELSEMAEAAIRELREGDPIVQSLWNDAYGYAVFDTTKGGLIVTGLGGTGIAQTKDGDKQVAMHLGGAGVGLGAGLENYKLVLLIQDEDTFNRLTQGQWDGSISAQASAGQRGVSADEHFVNGIASFRITQGGLMAQTDITAIRFWPSARLNNPAA